MADRPTLVHGGGRRRTSLARSTVVSALVAVAAAGCASSDAGSGIGSEPVELADATVSDGVEEAPDLTDGAPSVELGTVSEEDLLSGCLSEEGDAASGDGSDGGQSSSADDAGLDGAGLGQIVVLADGEGFRYCLGPALLVEVESATVGSIPGAGPTVDPVFTVVGIDVFNTLAAECFLANQAVCPTRRVAVVSDGLVISSPAINAARFARDQIVISGGFTEAEAETLASSFSASGRVEMRAVLLDLGPDLDP